MLEAVYSSAAALPSVLLFFSSVYGCSSGFVLLRLPSFDASRSQVENGLSETLLLVLRSPTKRTWRNA